MVYRLKPTTFDSIVTAAVEALIALRRAESMRKLSTEAFCARAEEISNASSERLAELAAIVEAGGRTALTITTRRLAGFIGSDNCPSLPTNLTKLQQIWRMHAADGVDLELTTVPCTWQEAMAVSVVLAVRRFPDRFGQVEDFHQHRAELARLRDCLNDYDHKMRNSYSAADLLVHKEPLPELSISSVNFNDKAAVDNYYREKYAREMASRSPETGPWLRRFPSISLAAPDWPSKLLNLLLSADPGGAVDQLRAQHEADLALESKKKKTRERNNERTKQRKHEKRAEVIKRVIVHAA